MSEVIGSILKAEAKSAEIIAAANEKSKRISIEAEELSEDIKNSAISDFKNERSFALAKAENKAEDVYAAAITDGKLAAQKLKDVCAQKIDCVADEIVGRLFK